MNTAYEVQGEIRGRVKFTVSARNKEEALEIARDRAEDEELEVEDIAITDIECLGDAVIFAKDQEF